MSFGIVATVGAAVAGAAISGSAAKKAANTQAASADRATELQREQFDIARQDQMPYMQRGNAAANRLQTLLGLQGANTYGAGGTRRTADDIRAELRATGVGRVSGTAGAPGAAGGVSGGLRGLAAAAGGIRPGYGPEGGEIVSQGGTSVTDATWDEAALDAAVQAELAQQDAQAQAADAQMRADPEYGSLLREFTGADLVNDPGYKFQLEQGQNALQTSRAGQGSLYSGAAGKALVRYGTDFAGTKFNEAFNRDQTTKGAIYNRLAGVAGTGQAATNQVGAAGQAFGQAAANNTIGAGNARASGYVAQGNALQGALNQGVAAYQRYNPPSVIDDGYSVGLGNAYGGNRAGL